MIDRARHDRTDDEPWERLIESFEQAWIQGELPRIEDYLPDKEPDRSQVFFEIAHIDLEFRVKSGEEVRPEDYEERFPDLVLNSNAAQSLRAWEARLRDELERSKGGDDVDFTHINLLNHNRQRISKNFRLLEEVGRGSMGVVYKAWHHELNRHVAVKVFSGAGGAGERELRRFRTEASILAKLDHPNIVRFIEIGNTNQFHYLCMEYIEGVKLSDTIGGSVAATSDSAGTLRIIRSVETVLILARAMDFAHQNKVIHRDLKPSNILMTADGTLKIVDFGLAKRLDDLESVTQFGALLGTPEYMAPEQIDRNWGSVTEAVDIYALGLILYEAVTGRRPFSAGSPGLIFDQVRWREPAPPSKLNPKVGKNLERVILKCLRKSPSDRYRSAKDFSLDLERFLKGETVSAKPTGRLHAAIDFIKIISRIKKHYRIL